MNERWEDAMLKIFRSKSIKIGIICWTFMIITLMILCINFNSIATNQIATNLQVIITILVLLSFFLGLLSLIGAILAVYEYKKSREKDKLILGVSLNVVYLFTVVVLIVIFLFTAFDALMGI
ncbi:hypothetical protein [Paenibacillus eucommiae]|uniref:Cobalamin biosynthesis protein CobD/CbiB n=1 Tax=Paenibacillus eucommiae TaxID=1355755 RepID=A0ABS4J1C2_9BACL|nr:hypothetical protein [Paenibacillus eucommiae]MBP1992921.1 cobalamin biosynthesis protein CobD/CbiB [Paenibacillus eucommiae]